MTLHSVNPLSGEARASVAEAAPADVAHAVGRAAAAFLDWQAASGRVRGRLLREMADRLESRRSEIVETADFETALGESRFATEIGRTTGQLRAFAALVEEGSYVEAMLSPSSPETGLADVRRMLVPTGPVGVFTPSNFPLAFGVAGGDTASALAAGCPVVVKGHPSHPATSELCFEVCAQAVTASDAPAGVLSLVQGSAPELSRTLVQAPEVSAIAFTGSERVGRLLFDLAAARARPIPFYGELGSLNPVFIGEHAARLRAAGIVDGLAGSILLGAGQFCTKPGLVFVPEGDAGDILLAALADRIGGHPPQPLLNPNVRDLLAERVATTLGVAGVEELTQTPPDGAGTTLTSPRLFCVDVEVFLGRPELSREHFGPAALVVRGPAARLSAAAWRLDGQLTATIHAEPQDAAWARSLLPPLVTSVGRLVWNGYPTGVSVVPAMHHGGPYPATTSVLHSSIGASAIRRFLRPVAFQNVPDDALPQALRDANPLGLQRLVGTEWTRRPVKGSAGRTGGASGEHPGRG